MRDAARTEAQLLRVLGPVFGVAVGVGGAIGGGILRTPGDVLGHAGTGRIALALWALAGLHCLLSANLMAEPLAAIRKSGGIFTISQRAFGDFGALLVGWTDWLQAVAGSAALGVALAEFAAMLFPPVRAWVGPAGAAALVLPFGLNWRGVREGGRAQIVSSFAKLVLLLALIGVIFAAPHSPAPTHADLGPAAGALGLIVAYQLVFGAYSGWNLSGYFAEEDVDPGVNIPRTMFITVLAVVVLYVLMNAALLHAMSPAAVRAAELPAAAAIGQLLGSRAVAAIALVAIVVVIGCVNANIMAAVRVLHGLARDGYLPSAIARVNRGGTPDVALAVTAGVTLMLAFTGRFEAVFLMMSALGLATSVIVDLAYFRMRWAEPHLPRPFRAIAHPWAPTLVLILDAGVLAAFLAADLKSAAIMAAGVAICLPLSWIARRRIPRGVQAAG
jgi:APA family basic amino acid/polyamine antiporter